MVGIRPPRGLRGEPVLEPVLELIEGKGIERPMLMG